MTKLTETALARLFDPEFEILYNAAVRILAGSPDMTPHHAVYLTVTLANTVAQHVPSASDILNVEDNFEDVTDDLLETLTEE